VHIGPLMLHFST